MFMLKKSEISLVTSQIVKLGMVRESIPGALTLTTIGTLTVRKSKKGIIDERIIVALCPILLQWAQAAIARNGHKLIGSNISFTIRHKSVTTVYYFSYLQN